MDPMLLNIPEELTTARLMLRVPRAGDGPVVAAAILASLPQLTPWFPWATDPYDANEAELWCRRSRGQFHLRQSLQYAIFETETGTFCSGFGVHRVDWKQGVAELGYWMRSDRVGRGYVSEAVDAYCAMVFKTTELRRLEIRCDVRNERSLAVARRAGFELEGTFRHDAIGPSGRPRDTHLLGRLRHD